MPFPRDTERTDPHSHTPDVLPTTNHVRQVADPWGPAGRAPHSLHLQQPQNCLLQRQGSLPGGPGAILPGHLQLGLLTRCLLNPLWLRVGTVLAPTVAPL